MPYKIVRNDITKMEVDAIVNTANPKPAYGDGIDSAVYKAAGEEALMSARRAIGDIAVGCCAVTDGFKLPARHIIHTVSAPWNDGADGAEDILHACYKASFACAEELKVKSLAIPVLASGSYGCPKGIALRIAISEIELFLKDHDMDIFLVVFDNESYSLSGTLYGEIESYISEHYVEALSSDEYNSAPRMSSDRAAGKLGSLPSRLGFNRSFRKSERVMEASCADADSEGTAPMLQKASARSLDDVIANLDKTFMELVFTYADAKGITDVELQNRSYIDKRAFSKLRCGTTKNPSKSTALALAVGLELNLDEAKDLLARAGFAFSPCSKQDLIVQFFIERGFYSLYDINIFLSDYGQAPIGSF